MKVLSVNVSLPKEEIYEGKSYRSAIGKVPATGPVKVSGQSLEGDGVGNPKYHGGEFMAVYAYDIADYKFWIEKRPDLEIASPLFGENLTTEGLEMNQINLGDQFRFGTSILMATLPRIPCGTLAKKMGDPKIVKDFLQMGRLGVYFRIVKEGTIEAGDQIELLEKDPANLRIYDLSDFVAKKKTKDDLMKHLEHPFMSEKWKNQVFT